MAEPVFTEVCVRRSGVGVTVTARDTLGSEHRFTCVPEVFITAGSVQLGHDGRVLDLAPELTARSLARLANLAERAHDEAVDA